MKNLFLIGFILCFLTIFYLIYQNGNVPMDILLSNRIGGLTLLGVVLAIASVVSSEDYQPSDILDDNLRKPSGVQKLEQFLMPYLAKPTSTDEYLKAFNLGLKSIRLMVDKNFDTEDKALLAKHFNVYPFDVTNLIISKMYTLPMIDINNVFYFGHTIVEKPIENKKAFANLVNACEIKFGKRNNVLDDNFN